MRLRDKEITAIKNAVKKNFGPDSRVMLFGSRVDDSKRGGDIDLLVETENISDLYSCKIKTLTDIQMKLGEQKIDIVVTDNITDDSRLIVRQAALTGISL